MGKWTRRWTRSIEKLLYRQRRTGDSLVPAKPVVVKMDERSQQDLLDSKSCSRSIDIPCMPRPGIYVLPSKPDAWNQSMNGQFLSVALRLLDTLNWTRREYKGKKGLMLRWILSPDCLVAFSSWNECQPDLSGTQWGLGSLIVFSVLELYIARLCVTDWLIEY